MVSKLKSSLPVNLYPIFIFIAVILTGLITPDTIGEGENIYLLIVTLEIIALVIPSIIYCHLQGFDYAKGLEIKIPELGKLPIIFSTLFAMISFNILLGLVMSSMGMISGTGSAGTVDSVPADMNILGVVIALAVIPAICEEFVFRSVLMRDYNKYGATFSIIATSVMFAMIHFDLSKLPVYFAGGVLLALSVYVTRSIVCSILIHTLYNVYGIFFESLFWKSISKNISSPLIVFIAVAVLLVSLLVLFSESQRIFLDYATMGVRPPEGYRKKDRNKDENKNTGVVQVLPAIGVCIIIFVIYIVIKG